jgi:hypothetical protein
VLASLALPYQDTQVTRSNSDNPSWDKLLTTSSRLNKYGLSLDAGASTLRSSLLALADKRSTIESEAQEVCGRLALPSPVATCILPTSAVRSIRDPAILREVVSHILRYLSPFPWGSPAAQSHQQSSSIQRICNALQTENPMNHKLRRFCAGSGVDWLPVGLVGDSHVLTNPDKVNAWIKLKKGPVEYGWMASRSIPSWKKPKDDPSMDVTKSLGDALAQGEARLQVLWDNRFLVTFDLRKMATFIQALHNGSRKIAILSASPFIRPQVVLMDHTGNCASEILHSKISLPTESLSKVRHSENMQMSGQAYAELRSQNVSHPGITIEWIRPFGEPDSI